LAINSDTPVQRISKIAPDFSESKKRLKVWDREA
jgi:hypothetical protein